MMEHIAEIVGEWAWEGSDDGIGSDHQFGTEWDGDHQDWIEHRVDAWVGLGFICHWHGWGGKGFLGSE